MAKTIEAKEIIERIPKCGRASVLIIGGSPNQSIEEEVLRCSRFITLSAAVPVGTISDNRIRELEEFSTYTLIETDGAGLQEAAFKRDGFDLKVDQRTGVIE